MSIIGLDGEYLVGIKLFVADDVQIEKAKSAQRQKVATTVQSRLSRMTVGDLVGMVRGNVSATQVLQGFTNYQGYGLDVLKGLMRPRSISTALSSAVRGIAAETRAKNPIKTQANQEVDLGLREQDFLELKVQEYLGILLPCYEVTFTVQDKKLYKYFNSSSRLEISFGKTESDLVTMNCTIYKPVIRDQEDGGTITLYGFYYAPDFLQHERQISYTGTSYKVLEQFVQPFNMKMETNADPEKFLDEMTWRASNTRPIEYLIMLWKHSFLGPKSQIAPCISATGTIYWTDLSQVRESAAERKIQYSDRIHLKENPFYKNFGNMRCQRFVHDVKQGCMTLLNLNDKDSAVAATKLDAKATGIRVGKFGMLTPEMHSNWYLAELLNHSKIFSTMQQTAWINPHESWKEYKPTDIITVNSVDSADSGQYLVCGRIAHIYNRKFNAWIQIARDTYAPVTGSEIKS